MHPIATIARFELGYHVRQPSFYLFAVLIFGQGIWYPSQLATLYAYNDTTLTTYLTMASLGVVIAIVAVLLAGQSLTKDLDHRTTAYLYSYPITSRMHFAGRFIGTYVAALLLAIGYPLGTGFYTLVFTPTESLPWLALIDGFIRLVGQNVFIVVSLTYSLTVFFRGIRGAYLSLFLVVFYFLLTESKQDLIYSSDIWQLLDPFGIGMARESVDSQSFADNLNGLLVYSDIFLINRMLWLGLAMGLLAYAENTFSFARFSTEKYKQVPRAVSEQAVYGSSKPLPVVRPEFNNWEISRTIRRMTKLTFLNLVRQPVFLLTASLLVMLAIFSITVLGQNPDFPELPITARMTALRLSVGYLISLYVIVLTGEVLFQERTVGFWPIYDALPQSNFVLLLAKLCALIGLAALLTLTLFLTGLGVQLSMGFAPIDWSRYAADLITDGFLRYVQLGMLAALVASLVNNRLISHLINLLLFAMLTVSYHWIQQPSWWLYSFLPGSATYSDLIGYGTNTDLRFLFQFLWWGIAGVFLTSFLLTWNRGVVVRFPERIGQWRNQFQWPYQLAFVVFGAMVGLSFWQTQQHLVNPLVLRTPRYLTRTETLSSVGGKTVSIQIRYHHPYQVSHMLRATKSAIAKGEALFGPFPFTDLQLVETPTGEAAISSKPAQIQLNETQGWIADNRQPTKLDYIDYLITREVMKQWLVHRLQPKAQPGDGFIRQSLAEYLALQSVGKQYGSARLKERLAQRASWFIKSRQQRSEPEPTLLQSSGNDGVERGRAALVLTSIEQVWGAKPLSFTISQFYKKAIQQPNSATATAFANEFASQLPDSLAYLRTYLSEPLWFSCKVGRIANLPDGPAVEVMAVKWREMGKGQRQLIPFNDYIPLAVLDQTDHVIHHQLVHPDPDNPFVVLPKMPAGSRVVIDPLGSWPELNKRDNTKLLGM